MRAKSVAILNKTHWQTRDVGNFVRACTKAARWKKPVNVVVDFAKPGNTFGEWDWHKDTGRLILNLPRRGPKDDALTMLATTAVSEEHVLSPRVVFGLARRITASLIDSHPPSKITNRIFEFRESLRSGSNRIRPTWLPDNMYIRRYAKKKAPPKKTFFEKIEEALVRAESRVEDWEAQIEHAESNLKRARRDLKTEQKRMRDARKRAKERGEAVEFIGPGHRLRGRF